MAYKRKRYALGIQKVEVPEVRSTGDVIGAGVGGAQTGAEIGKMLGPAGMGIGAGVGAGVGLIKSAIEKQAEERREATAKAHNEYVETQSQFDINPVEYLNDDKRSNNYSFKTGTGNMEDTKPVEVERDELIFGKSPSGRFMLKADFKGGKTHKQGGEDYLAEEGDVIFPGKMRKKVERAYKNNDNESLERMRLKLPKDKPTPVYPNGVDEIYPYNRQNTPQDVFITKGNTGQGRLNLSSLPTLPNAEQPIQPQIQPQIGLQGESATPRGIQSNSLRQPQTGQSDSGFNADKVGGALSTGLELAPSIYNMGKYLFDKPEEIQSELYKPELIDTNYDINPQLREVEDMRYARTKAASQFGGGNVGGVLSNINKASLDSLKQKQGLKGEKFNIEQQLRNKNVDLENQASLTNLQIKREDQRINEQNRAAHEDYLTTALSGVSDYSQSRRNTGRQEQLQRDYNESLIPLLKSRNYTYDPDSGEVVFIK